MWTREGWIPADPFKSSQTLRNWIQVYVSHSHKAFVGLTMIWFIHNITSVLYISSHTDRLPALASAFLFKLLAMLAKLVEFIAVREDRTWSLLLTLAYVLVNIYVYFLYKVEMTLVCLEGPCWHCHLSGMTFWVFQKLKIAVCSGVGRLG